MKIAIFTDTYLPEFNGIVTSIQNFSERHAKKGHEIHIFCPKYDKNYIPKDKRIKVHRFPAFAFSTNKNTKIAFPSVIKVLNQLRKIQPDIIHIQTPMNIGVTGLLASKLLDIPNIQTYHTYIPDFMVYLSPKKILGVDDFYEKLKDTELVTRVVRSRAFKELADFKEDTEEYANKLRESLNVKGVRGVQFSDRFAWNFTRFLYSKADLVLAPSNALCRILRRHRVKARVEFQSNGIEYNYFLKKADYKIKEKIVHVGRLGLEKDVDVVVRAMPIILKKHPDLRLDIIGDGPAYLKIKELIEKLELTESVKLLGYISREELRKKYRTYDFFVTASVIETQGLVILEAMSSGLPAVGVNRLAAPEIIIDKQTGYLARPKNAKSLAEKMALLLESAEKNAILGQGAKEMALSHHIYGEVDKLENYYKEVVSWHKNKKK